MHRWFDAHLDLAYVAENGRDLTAEPEVCGGPDQPASVTFASLARGGVSACLGTIFTEADGPAGQNHCYAEGDWPAANAAGVRQLRRYHAWRAAGQGPRVGVLIEGADPVLDPGDVGWWKGEGVVAVGMAWWKPSRYAGGNGSDVGLTDRGVALARAMDAAGVLHDASHLSDRAFWDLARVSARVIVASHSNCRALVGGGGRGENQRHLHDDQIREIAARGGVVGLNLYSRFLRPGLDAPGSGRAAIADCVAHVEHVCALAGSRAHVGLGSDADGGFPATRLPGGLDRPEKLERLAGALAARGWSQAELDGFRFGNWARVLGWV
jgi:membrane dipeptidase